MYSMAWWFTAMHHAGYSKPFWPNSTWGTVAGWFLARSIQRAADSGRRGWLASPGVGCPGVPSKGITEGCCCPREYSWAAQRAALWRPFRGRRHMR